MKAPFLSQKLSRKIAKVPPKSGLLARASVSRSCEVALGVAHVFSPHPARDAEVHGLLRNY
jgi:hypothetical protein